MNKTFSALALILCGWWGASTAKGTPTYSPCDSVVGNLVSNCGFETGDFTSWTLGGNNANPVLYYGVDAFDANSGNYGAYLSSDLIDGTGPLDLSQTLTTIAGFTYDVSFYLEQDTQPYVNNPHSFTATMGGTTLLTLTPSPASPGPYGSFLQYVYSFTATGTSSVLNFAALNEDNFWSLDDVTVVSTTVTPEPSTWATLGAGLLGLCVAARRKAA